MPFSARIVWFVCGLVLRTLTAVVVDIDVNQQQQSVVRLRNNYRWGLRGQVEWEAANDK